MRRRSLGAVLALALIAAACGGGSAATTTSLAATTSTASDGTVTTPAEGGESLSIKVGLTSAMSGEISYYGQDALKGAQLAVAELAETDPNIQIELVTADDECNPEGGASAYRHLADIEQVDVILGSACSGATLGGMPVLQQSKVPGMTFGSTNYTITEMSGVGGNEYSWRMNIDDSIMGATWVQYIADAGFERAAILAANNDFGRGAAELYTRLLPEAGVELVSTEYYDLSTSDVRPMLQNLQRAGADVLITFAEPSDCALFLRQMNELGIALPLHGRGGCATYEALELLGDQVALADGVKEATYWAPTPAQQELLDRYDAAHGGIPPYNTALAYYGMHTIIEALKIGGEGREGIQAGLAQVDWESGIGRIRFDDHHQGHPNMFILEVRDGEVIILDEIPTDPEGLRP